MISRIYYGASIESGDGIRQGVSEAYNVHASPHMSNYYEMIYTLND